MRDVDGQGEVVLVGDDADLRVALVAEVWQQDVTVQPAVLLPEVDGPL